MIKHLYIQNFILIDKLNLDFEDGFSALIGETGAGKSILIDAKGKNSYVGYEYRDVKITYEYDKSYSAQSWFISPK